MKAYWNYRVRKSAVQSETFFEIVEAHYVDDRIVGVTQNGVAPVGETEEELKQCLLMMMEAFKKPTIEDK